MSSHVVDWSRPPSWVNPRDADTWTYRRDEVPGVGTLSTVWHPVAFATWRTDTPPRHFESLLCLPEGGHGDSRTYVTEEEAKDGHARLLSALRLIAETLP